MLTAGPVRLPPVLQTAPGLSAVTRLAGHLLCCQVCIYILRIDMRDALVVNRKRTRASFCGSSPKWTHAHGCSWTSPTA